MTSVKDYYRKKESKWGYRIVLGGTRHLGFYKKGELKVSVRQAMKNMQDLVGETIKLPSGSRILDAGCGEGSTSCRLAKKFGYKVVGVDLLEESIEKALNNRVKNTDFKVASYLELPFKDNSFDAVFTLETYVHTPDLDQPLKEFLRVLKPGGRLVMVEYSSNFKKIIDKQLSANIISACLNSSMPLFEELTHGYYPELLSRNNFKNITIKNISDSTKPMLKFFERLALPLYIVIKKNPRLVAKFPNIVAGAVWYSALELDAFRENLIVAHK